MFRAAPTLLLVLFLSAPVLSAEKTEAKKPLGTWQRQVGDRTITFMVKADSMLITIGDGDKKIEATASYGVTSEGTLFGIITKVEKKDTEGGPSRGDLFSFQFSATKTELTVSDLNGTKASEQARKTVEGVYSASK